MNDELLQQVLANLKNSYKDYFQTGFKNLDSLAQIPAKGAFILIGSRPCMGNTELIFSILLKIAAKQENILFFSPTYSKETAIKKLLLMKSGINIKKYYGENFNNIDFQALSQSIEEIKNLNIHFNDNPAIELDDVTQAIIEIKPKIVFIEEIDTINLIASSSSKKSVFDKLQKLAQEKKCIIIATTTLSKKPEERDDHRPTLVDLKEFKFTKYIDIVLLIYRDAYYEHRKSRKDKTPNSEIIIAKNKYGSTGTIYLEFDSNYGKFYEKHYDVFNI